MLSHREYERWQFISEGLPANGIIRPFRVKPQNNRVGLGQSWQYHTKWKGILQIVLLFPSTANRVQWEDMQWLLFHPTADGSTNLKIIVVAVPLDFYYF